MLILGLFITQSLWAQDTFDNARMQAIQSLEEVLVAGGDMDRFIEERLDTSYRSSMSHNAMKDHLRRLSKAVINAQALDLAVEPDVVNLIFSDGATATITVRFAAAAPDKIEYIGFKENKSPGEMTPSERLAEAQRKRMRAVEAIGNARNDRQLEAFVENHVSPAYLNTVSKEELIAQLRSLQPVIATSGTIMLEQSAEGSLMKFRGQENADVRFTLAPSEPHLITLLSIDTEVDASEEMQEAVTLAPITWANLKQRLVEETQAGFSGAVLAIKNGEVVHRKGYGYADKELELKNGPSTIFGIGSIPIDFTIAAILRLEDTGALSLSDPVSTFFPKAPADKSTITLDQLMRGQSGLPNFHHRPEVDDDYDLSWIDRDEAVGRILNQPLLFTPGTQRAHSHSAFVLLAAVVEIASGSSYPDYVRDTFFEPMGMAHTGFYGEKDRFGANQFAVGYGYRAVSEKNIPINWGPTSWLIMGSGGMFSTIDDLHTWIKEIRSGEYLSQKALNTYGMGGVASGISDRGFMATYINDPNDTIIYLTNSHASEGDVSMVLGEQLVRMVLDQNMGK